MVRFVYGELHYFEGNYAEPTKKSAKKAKLVPCHSFDAWNKKMSVIKINLRKGNKSYSNKKMNRVLSVIFNVLYINMKKSHKGHIFNIIFRPAWRMKFLGGIKLVLPHSKYPDAAGEV